VLPADLGTVTRRCCGGTSEPARFFRDNVSGVRDVLEAIAWIIITVIRQSAPPGGARGGGGNAVLSPPPGEVPGIAAARFRAPWRLSATRRWPRVASSVGCVALCRHVTRPSPPLRGRGPPLRRSQQGPEHPACLPQRPARLRGVVRPPPDWPPGGRPPASPAARSSAPSTATTRWPPTASRRGVSPASSSAPPAAQASTPPATLATPCAPASPPRPPPAGLRSGRSCGRGRWRWTAMAQRHIRSGSLFQENAAAYVGL
jgi:hypothetical protein